MKALLFALMLLVLAPVHAGTSRLFQFTYSANLPSPSPRGGVIDLFIPIAVTGPGQSVVSREIEASIPGQIRPEETHGNTYWHGHVDGESGKAVSVKISYVIEAGAGKGEVDGEGIFAPYGGAEEEMNSEGSPVSRARALYDQLLTEPAPPTAPGRCLSQLSQRFIASLRSQGIPARAEGGVVFEGDPATPKPRCWVGVYLLERGWVGIDLDQARERPNLRAASFATEPADRLRFSVGEELRLDRGEKSVDLAAFIHPRVTVGGLPLSGVEARFGYRDLLPPRVSSPGGPQGPTELKVR